MSVDETIDHEVIDRFEAAGQGHVFSFWEELSTDQRCRLVAQASTIDLGQVSELTGRYVDSPKDHYFRGYLESADIIQIPRTEQERKEHPVGQQVRAQHVDDRERDVDDVVVIQIDGGSPDTKGIDHDREGGETESADRMHQDQERECAV